MKKNEFLIDKLIYVNVIIQLILLALTSRAINFGNTFGFLKAFIFIILSILNFLNFFISIVGSKNNLIKNSNIIGILGILYVIFFGLKIEYWFVNIIKTVCWFELIISYINILTEGLVDLRIYTHVILFYGFILALLKPINYTVFIFFYQLGYLLMGFFPLYIIIFNKRIFMKYGTYSMIFTVFISLVFLFFLLSPFIIFIPDISLNNINEIIIIILLEILKIFLIFKSFFKFEILAKNIKDLKSIFIFTFLFIILYYILKIKIIDSLVLTWMITQLLKFFSLIDRYFFIKNMDMDTLLTKEMKEREYLEKQEHLYSEKITRFLHDEILQYIILALRELKNNNKYENNNHIIELLESTNLRIRQEINLYDPKISNYENLEKVYYELIKEIQSRFNNDNILIDFTFDNSLKLVRPYDLIVYKFLHELIVNIFKHSKGNYSEINIKQVDKEIIINVENIGDYLEGEELIDNQSVGLKLLNMDAERLGGEFNMFSPKKNTLKNEDSFVQIIIKIPIRKEVIYEDFINRRS